MVGAGRLRSTHALNENAGEVFHAVGALSDAVETRGFQPIAGKILTKQADQLAEAEDLVAGGGKQE